MGYRLSRITTRTGDGGETGLADGSRLPKDSLRVAALGDVDELNSAIGLLASEALPEPVASALSEVQHDLFDLGGELALPGHPSMSDRHVEELEARIAQLNAGLEPLRDFVLPGGTRAAALAHLARTVCRRAERTVVTLARQENVPDPCRVYLNRLSDFLFVAARALNRASGQPDVLWRPRAGGPTA